MEIGIQVLRLGRLRRRENRRRVLQLAQLFQRLGIGTGLQAGPYQTHRGSLGLGSGIPVVAEGRKGRSSRFIFFLLKQLLRIAVSLLQGGLRPGRGVTNLRDLSKERRSRRETPLGFQLRRLTVFLEPGAVPPVTQGGESGGSVSIPATVHPFNGAAIEQFPAGLRALVTVPEEGQLSVPCDRREAGLRRSIGVSGCLRGPGAGLLLPGPGVRDHQGAVPEVPKALKAGSRPGIVLRLQGLERHGIVQQPEGIRCAARLFKGGRRGGIVFPGQGLLPGLKVPLLRPCAAAEDQCRHQGTQQEHCNRFLHPSTPLISGPEKRWAGNGRCRWPKRDC